MKLSVNGNGTRAISRCLGIHRHFSPFRENARHSRKSGSPNDRLPVIGLQLYNKESYPFCLNSQLDLRAPHLAPAPHSRLAFNPVLRYNHLRSPLDILPKSKIMLFTKTLLQEMLQAALSAVESQLAMLNQLDAATGDGDHGTAILAAMKAANAAAQKEGTLKATLETIGWDVMSNTSGSTSALMGSFFIGLSQAVSGEELDSVQTVAIFESGLANIRTSTRATIGDKTLMDALIPAIEAMTALKAHSPTLADLFTAAADAAQKGADSTKELAAKFGRAKNLGERSRGSLDAGAVSTALIYQAYADAVRGH